MKKRKTKQRVNRRKADEVITILSSPKATRSVAELATKKNEHGQEVFSEKISMENIRSNDYDKLKPDWEWNRPFNGTTPEYKKMFASMERDGFHEREAIVVNSQRWITSGNHRYHAAKELKIPFYYFVSDHITKDNIVIESNQGRNWSLEDAFNLWLKHGRHDYILANNIMKKFMLPINVATAILMRKMPGKNTGQIVKDGKLIVTKDTYERSAVICKKLNDVRMYPYFHREKWSNIANFISSILEIMEHENYNHTRMKDAIKTRGGNVVKASTKDAWMRQLLAVYNKSLPKARQILIV